MDKRRNCRVMASLVVVQRVRRLAAEVKVEEALAEERTALAASDAAHWSCETAHQEWVSYIGRTSFSPEYSRALSRRLLDREAEAQDAAARADRKGEARSSSQRDLLERHAQLRQTERSARRMRRDVERRNEERKLAAANDRTTYVWWQQ